jgi:hypothetical protein
MHNTDFTEKTYRKMLRLAKKKYDIISYDEVARKKRFMVLRHDIDHSVHRALRLAEIEKREDVSSTYLLWIGSFFYNVFEDETRKLITRIMQLGHDIGLHFDPTVYRINSEEDMKQWLRFERNILENIFGVKIKVFSFHNPTENILVYDKFKYAGMVNAYAKYFREKVAYCSDSNGYWRHERLEDMLKENKYDNLQVLIHPGWWQEKPMPPRERIKRCIDGRAKKQLSLYDKILKEHGRKNIGE